MIVAAANGWAIPSVWFDVLVRRHFPEAQVRVLTPSNPADGGEAKKLIESAAADLYFGYSLGSLWLLSHRAFLPSEAERALLAPILGFCSERDKGGKTPESKLKYLVRVLKRNPEDRSPLLDFYAECGVSFSAEYSASVSDADVLLNGLDFLGVASVSEEAAAGFSIWVGDADPLLDAVRLQHLLPHLEIVPDAGHAPEPLVQKLAERYGRSGRH